MQDYKLEIPGSTLEIHTINDADALYIAKKEVGTRAIMAGQFGLYRYPKDWASRGGELIYVGVVTASPSRFGRVLRGGRFYIKGVEMIRKPGHHASRVQDEGTGHVGFPMALDTDVVEVCGSLITEL